MCHKISCCILGHPSLILDLGWKNIDVKYLIHPSIAFMTFHNILFFFNKDPPNDGIKYSKTVQTLHFGYIHFFHSTP